MSPLENLDHHHLSEPELIEKGLIICRTTQKAHPFGIFYGENPLHYSFPLMLMEISFIIIVTRTIRWILTPLKQPRIVSEILGGIIIGPSVLGRNEKFTRYLFPENASFLLKNVAVMGFMYFLFLTGVKMDLATMAKAGKKQWYIAVFGVLGPVITVFVTALIVRTSLVGEMHKITSILGVSAALAITSFPVLYPIIRELNLLSSDMGRMALSTAVISDVFGITIVIAFEAAKHGEVSPMISLWYLISFFSIAFSIRLGIKQVLLWIIRTTPEGKPVEQVYVVSILLGVLVLGFLADSTGVAIANGPLWLGLAVPDGPPLGSTLVEKSETIVMEILMPFSYAYVGMIFNLSTMSDKWAELKPLFYMAMSGYLSKFLITFALTRWFCMPPRDGLGLSLIQSLRGQVEILLFMHWMDLNMIGEADFTLLMILSVCVTAIATPLIQIIYDPTRPYMVNKARDIQHNPPNAGLNIVLCIHDEASVAGFLNLLAVSNPTISSPFSVNVIHLIELVGRAIPMFIDHNIVEDVAEDKDQEQSNHSSIHNAMQQFEEGRTELIRINAFTSVSPKKSMYNDICELALVKKASLIILPFKKESLLDGPTATTLVNNNVQSVNLSVLAHAPCSVGVFVDKGSIKDTSGDGFLMNDTYHHFVVLFLGGADSREALAYADRMAGNSDVSLTVIRFLALNGEGDDLLEKKLDDGLVTWFWVKNEGNNQVAYREVTVRNGDETMAAIQAMNSDSYDLWIVGRKHGINPLLVQGLDNWSENLELGVIGDYVASDDLGSRASVLVIQQQIMKEKEKWIQLDWWKDFRGSEPSNASSFGDTRSSETKNKVHPYDSI